MPQTDVNSMCFACPRRCGTERDKKTGFCGVGYSYKIARVGLHEWEEPCISYGKGSGTVFFSGCNLGCVFCQNSKISHGYSGKYIDDDTLLYEMQRLEHLGAVNINLVTPSHYAFKLPSVLEKFKEHSDLPIVYNTGGYDSVTTLRNLCGLVDIYLPDLKYFSSAISAKYSGASDYFEKAFAAIREMHRQTGYAVFDDDGHMKSGMLVRHLILPGMYRDSFAVLDALSREFDPQRLPISLMSQYFPTDRAHDFPEINRKLTTLEYGKVTDYALKLGFVKGYVQERTSAKEEYVPDFDY